MYSRHRYRGKNRTIMPDTVYTVSFLDSLCSGLVIPLLTPRILKLGGSHAVAGVLATSQALCQIISVPLIHTLCKKYGDKDTLRKTIITNLITTCLLGLTDSYWHFVFIRCIYCLTNQTSYLCINVLKDLVAKDKHFHMISTVHALGVVGFVVGAVVGGYIFELLGFWEVCLAIIGANFASVVLLSGISSHPKPPPKDEDASEKTKTSPSSGGDEAQDKRVTKKIVLLGVFTEELSKNVASTLKDFDANIYRSHIFLVLETFLFNASMTVFFMKYPVLLKVSHKASTVVIGYTVAYQRMIMFVVNFGHAFIKSYFNPLTLDTLINVFFGLTLSFIGLCFAPTYEIYLMSFIPMIVAKVMIGDFWKDPFITVPEKRKNVSNAINLVARTTEIVMPLVFGIFCDLYLELALQIFVMVPLLMTLIVLPFSDRESKGVEKVKSSEEKKNE